jgi:hypothetical protein
MSANGSHIAVRYALLLGATFAAAQAPVRSRPADSAEHARVAHVLVALADNKFQGIVPVPPAIGNGDDPARNLYWGARYGLKTFLRKSADWELIGRCELGKGPVLERCIFRSRHQPVYVVADAYRGREIKVAVSNFFAFSAGRAPEICP